MLSKSVMHIGYDDAELQNDTSPERVGGGNDRANRNCSKKAQSLNQKQTATSPGRAFRWAGFLSRLCLILMLCIAAYILTGFVRFASHVSSAKPDTLASITQPADGIVVLTGGSGRIKASMELLMAGKGKRLLISGVNPNVSKQSIQIATRGDEALFSCCVDLDRAALDTIGNAEQTAQWAKDNKFTNIIIVTSTYHMPRSLLEMRRYAPDVEIRPYRVAVKPLSQKSWINDPQSLKLMISEYLKFLAASIEFRLISSDRQFVLSKLGS